MRQAIKTLCIALFLLAIYPQAATAEGIFQYSTIDALLAGLYDGGLTADRLKTQGDFGLGTFNTLDGEMVMLDGVIYHAMPGGKAEVVPDSAKLPFAVVTRFAATATLPLDDMASITQLNAAVRTHLPTENAFFALRVDGRFAAVTVRAVPPQEKPYKPLAEVIGQQVVTPLTDIQGSLVGFWTPAYMKGVNVPGFHWHFISADGTTGGHVLACAFSGLSVRLDEIRNFSLVLPFGEFDALDLSPDRGNELHRVESAPQK